ncbi:MAG TPA: hypothetical protein ENI26_14150 [Methylophaga aminisulfidivorans]|uniref:Homing endonuclease LAGLIDADG domain-containing protein n=1 Tax=Methylophaga aminisulfidivorans TaxID=230105 RepID=A0A7C1ZJ18_9GAMM|nr:hypothetical protein [Methylophaga aminisulfidivorans]
MNLDCTECDLAYLAGMLDGEGTFSIQRTKNNVYCPRMNVGNTDKAALEWLKSKFDGHLRPADVPKEPHHKQVWVLQWRVLEMLELIPKLLLFLHIKKKQAEIVLEYISHFSMCITRANIRTQEQLDHRIALFNEMRALNHRGVSV